MGKTYYRSSKSDTSAIYGQIVKTSTEFFRTGFTYTNILTEFHLPMLDGKVPHAKSLKNLTDVSDGDGHTTGGH